MTWFERAEVVDTTAVNEEFNAVNKKILLLILFRLDD